VLQFAEEEGQALDLAVFFAFGVFASATLEDAGARTVAYALLSLTVVRMVPVAIAVAGQHLSLKTVAFLGWFGPRGLASIILGFVVVQEQPELAGLQPIVATVTVTVLLSVLAHGLTAAPLTRAYARDRFTPSGGCGPPPPAGPSRHGGPPPPRRPAGRRGHPRARGVRRR